MKIAVIGTHGVGKTTFSHMLTSHLMRQGKSAFMVSEVVRECPFPINDKSSVDGGYWIVTEQIARELKAKAQGYEIIVCDRSSIDPVMYLNARHFLEHYNDLYEFAHNWMKTYDVIFYIEPAQGQIKSDGFRDTDKRFQEKVDEEFNLYLNSIFINNLKTNIYKVDSGEIFESPVRQIINRTIGDEEWQSLLHG